MIILGSVLLVGGIAGLVLFLLAMSLRPEIAPRGLAAVILGVLFAVAGAGLVILTIATGGRSLHTGG